MTIGLIVVSSAFSILLCGPTLISLTAMGCRFWGRRWRTLEKSVKDVSRKPGGSTRSTADNTPTNIIGQAPMGIGAYGQYTPENFACYGQQFQNPSGDIPPHPYISPFFWGMPVQMAAALVNQARPPQAPGLKPPESPQRSSIVWRGLESTKNVLRVFTAGSDTDSEFCRRESSRKSKGRSSRGGIKSAAIVKTETVSSQNDEDKGRYMCWSPPRKDNRVRSAAPKSSRNSDRPIATARRLPTSNRLPPPMVQTTSSNADVHRHRPTLPRFISSSSSFSSVPRQKSCGAKIRM